MREGGRELSRGHTARMYFSVRVVCDWIAFHGREDGRGHLGCPFVSSENHEDTKGVLRVFSPKWRLPRPFSFVDHRGTSWWTSGQPRFEVVWIPGGIGGPILDDRGAVSHRRSERRLGLLCCTAAFGRGQLFVGVFDTPAELSCLRQWSCFEFLSSRGWDQAGVSPAIAPTKPRSSSCL